MSQVNCVSPAQSAPLHDPSDYDGCDRLVPAARNPGHGPARGGSIQHLDPAGRERLDLRGPPDRPILRQWSASRLDLAHWLRPQFPRRPRPHPVGRRPAANRLRPGAADLHPCRYRRLRPQPLRPPLRRRPAGQFLADERRRRQPKRPDPQPRRGRAGCGRPEPAERLPWPHRPERHQWLGRPDPERPGNRAAARAHLAPAHRHARRLRDRRPSVAHDRPG